MVKKQKVEIGMVKICEALVQSSQDIIFAVGPRLEIQLVNLAAARFFKMKPKQAIGKSIKSLFPPKIAKRHVAELRAVFKTGKNIYTESQAGTNDREAWLSTSLTPSKNEKGVVIGVVGVSRDLTDSKKTHEALSMFKLGIEKSSDAIFMTDIDGLVTFVNPGFEKIYGWKAEEVLGKNPRIWRAEHQGKVFYKNFWKQILAGQTVETEFMNKTRDGEEVIIQSNISPIINEGNIVGFLAIQKNVTSYRHNEESLTIRESQLEIHTHAMNERAKELHGLYELIKLSSNPKLSINEIFEDAVNLLPPAWQYPEIACGRIVFEDKIFKTKNFRTSKWKQSADINCAGKYVGEIVVYYLKKMPNIDEGPFMKQERNLINALAEHLGIIIERKVNEKELAERIQQMECIGKLNLKCHKKMLALEGKVKKLEAQLAKKETI